MSKENDVTLEKKEEAKDLKYSKAELILNEKYLKHQDVLNVLLKENELYSFLETDKIIEKFRKGRV